MTSRKRVGARYRRARELMFAHYGHICHLCGHDGAMQADHLVTFREDPDQPIDWRDMRPAHGGNRRGYDNPCPTCGRRCNQERGATSLPAAKQRFSQPSGYRPSREW